MTTAVVGGTLFTPDRKEKEGVVLFSGGKILAAGSRKEIAIPQDARVLDAGGGYIVPGFVDIHVHGGMGADVTEGSREVFETMSRFFVRHGVTSFVASVLTVEDAVLLRVLETARAVMKEDDLPGARLLGIHLEGPWLNAAEAGAHPRHLLREPRPEHYLPLLEYADVIRMVTLAPELDGAAVLVKTLKEHGIVAAAGHTDAIDRQMMPVVAAGMTHSTHMFCNMSHFRRDDLKRVGGAVETILNDDRITTELIADGHHLGETLMQLTVKVKGVDKVCFVTDAMPAAGMPDGIYHIGGVEAVVKEGAARLTDNSAYAGSVTTMDICVRNGVEKIGLTPAESVTMATATPARIIGSNKENGSLGKGKRADIVFLNKNMEVMKTIVGGKEMEPLPTG